MDRTTYGFDDRTYRVAGLDRNTTFERLQVNILVEREGVTDCYVDILNLYSGRDRGHFTKAASAELDVDPAAIKRDLGQLLLILEAELQDRLTTSASPTRPPVMTDDDRAEATDYLCASGLLGRIAADLAVAGGVGEEGNRLVSYLVATSRLLDEPLSLVVLSQSGAGKTALVNSTLDLVPDEAVVRVSAMSPMALFYSGDLQNRILAVEEQEGTGTATYSLKILQSAGRLTLATTTRVKAGKTTTEHHTVEGPVALMTTSTSTKLDAELLRPLLESASADLSPQARNVLAQAQRIAGDGSTFTRRQLAEFAGLSIDQTRHLLSRLVEHELVEPVSGRRGRRFQYRLVGDLAEPRESASPGDFANGRGHLHATSRGGA